jgi:MYXO-CTERM domain-containing protein
MTRSIQFILGALALVAPLSIASEAQAADASLSSCGNIYVEAEAECEVLVEGGCTAQCEPVSVQAACAADLKVDCDGECNVSASAECSGSCEADCAGRCDVDPGSFNCTADCQADCSAECSGRCSADSNSAECQASCKATCSGECDAQCTGTPPEATCEAKCQASCSGSCRAEANADCQIMCQADGFAECTATVEGGCEAQCEKPDGAIFCDGQYVDAGNNLQECIAALQAIFNIEVYAEGSASCEGNTCMAEGEVGCSCSADGGDAPALAGLLGLGLVFATRRRRR